MNKEARDRFFAGESVRGQDFTNDLSFYGEVVHPGWVEGYVEKQPDFWNEVWYKNINGRPEQYPTVVKENNNGTTKTYGKR